jgi:hypothetical protein
LALFGLAIEWKRLTEVEANCFALPAFDESRPEKQPDFET